VRTNSSRFLPVSQSDITITQYKAILAKNSMVSPHSYPLSRFLKLTFHVLNRHKSNERNSCRNKMARSTPNTSSLFLLLYTVVSTLRFVYLLLVTITSSYPSLSTLFPPSLYLDTRCIVHCPSTTSPLSSSGYPNTAAIDRLSLKSRRTRSIFFGGEM